MRVRVMIPAHRRNRDTVVVLRYLMPSGYCSWISSLTVFNAYLMRKILIKIGPVRFVEQAVCKLKLLAKV